MIRLVLKVFSKIVSVVLGIGLVVLLGPFAWAWISNEKVEDQKTFDFSPYPVAIVFGAAVNPDSTASPWLAARLDKAAEIYQEGKIKAILVSGAGTEANYNEPAVMQKYLVEKGVNPADIVQDRLGVDTFSTCMRANRVYGVTHAVLISQSFHLPRANWACRHAGIDAVSLPETTTNKSNQIANYLRELPATTKLGLDFLTGRETKFDSLEKSSELAEALARK